MLILLTQPLRCVERVTDCTDPLLFIAIDADHLIRRHSHIAQKLDYVLNKIYAIGMRFKKERNFFQGKTYKFRLPELHKV